MDAEGVEKDVLLLLTASACGCVFWHLATASATVLLSPVIAHRVFTLIREKSLEVLFLFLT